MKPGPANEIYDHFFVARQPIFYDHGQIWGYELLFRSGPESNLAAVKDEDLATFSVATSGFIRSQEDLDQTKKISINFTEKLLMQGAPEGLPPSVTVIEVLENVLPSAPLIELLVHYKQQGYLVAIDDFEGRKDIGPLLDVADIIKVDVLNKSVADIEAICGVFQDSRAIRIAEKVEDRAILPDLKSMGFTLYQGYYFAKPEMLRGRKIGSTELSKLRVLQVVEDTSAGPEKVEKVIAADPSITYRLLRFLNSAAFGFSARVTSIRYAITLLGMKRLRSWLRMVILSDLLGKKSPELYIMSLNRGKLLEELANENQIRNENPETLFLFGLLSLMDAMLDTPMADLLSQLPIAENIKAGYVNEKSTYHKYLRLLVAIEQSLPDDISFYCKELHLAEKEVAAASLRSIIWANNMHRHLLS
ncbi:MAG: HDOD domain-containing protein [Desulfobacteraceae bacterium]|nr:HDOD domain-containing protein [Desulfobacteraceae bacterium]